MTETRPRYEEPFGEAMAEPRMSALAVVALVLSLICLLPVIPLLGAGLGLAALLKINGSQGRLAGAGMALLAICLGLVISLAQGAVGYFVYEGAKTMQSFIGPATQQVGAVVREVGAGDFDAARSHFSPEAAKAITDQDLSQMRAAIAAHYGEYDRTITSIVEAVRLAKTSPSLQGSQNVQIGGGGRGGGRPMIPGMVVFKKGPALIFAAFNPRDAKSHAPMFDDVLVMLPGRQGLTLREDGPAKQIALDFGLEPVYGEKAMPKEGSAPAAPAEAAPAAPKEGGA